jgi:prepilin-type N-terminal cleavage/methylation domain-containing protein
MNMYRSHSKSQGDGRLDDKGFTLIEILIAIVLIGILSAVAVVGIGALVSKGSTSACTATSDAAKAGSAVYFGDLSTYPATLALLADGVHLTLPTGVTVNPAAGTTPVSGVNMQTMGTASWKLTMLTAGTATTPPTFGCT